jgi:carboxypeptidase C (cathepsin A)
MEIKEEFICSRYSLTVLTCLLITLAIAGQSQTARTARSLHHGTFNAQSIDYASLVNEFFFYADSNPIPVVSAMTTAYIKENNPSEEERPLLFVFNGGPGASSSPLHMNAFGPWRIKRLDSTSELIENPYSLLDLTDLVFMDPPGTGHTRILDSKAAAAYWDVKGDAQIMLDMIQRWKRENHREASPVFLCGESYGTTRAATMLGLAKKQSIAGVIFLSSLFDLSIVTPAPGNDMPYILFLPSMAATAWYHQKLNPKIKTSTQAYENAIDFGQKQYISALVQGNSLSAYERNRIALKLSTLTGLSLQTILKKNLRITPDDFEHLLLADEGKRIGQLNSQVTGPLHTPGVKPPFDDPSMTLNPSTRAIVGKYFNEILQFSDTVPYKTLNLEVNSKWNWISMQEDIGYATVAPYITKALHESPSLRLFAAGGYYDLATPLYAARFVLEHAGVPADRVTYANFPTGHSIFENEEELKKLAGQIRKFILLSKN